MKTIKLILEDLRSINADPMAAFKVKKVTNSIEYQIGDYVSKARANELCKLPGYTIDIVAKS